MSTPQPFRNLDREWDEILIIDLLTDAERLGDRITETLCNLLKAVGIGYTRVNCDTREEVFDALKSAVERAKDKSFMIHFTAHGNESMIGNNSGLGVSWQDLRGPLKLINEALNGDLVVNLLACKGFAGINIDDVLDPEAAFYAFIGPTRSLNGQEMRDVTTQFYTELMNDSMIPTVVGKVISHFDPKLPIIWARSSQSRRNQSTTG
jgi:hypothetical protein